MNLLGTLPAFLLAVLLIAATPGPAFALILRRAAVHGTRATVPTVLGLELGLFLWALAAGAGLAALVTASTVAYTVLRIAGAVLLVTLGVRAWRRAWNDNGEERAGVETPARRSARGSFVEGVLIQLANPKAAVFMLALYPQFVPADGPVLLWSAALGLLQVTVETGLYIGLAAAVGRASGWFRRPRIRRRLEAVTGTVLVALGVRVAVSR
jgi:threonine/homoserine/homoserine lactone efflux protein